jgi:DNA invertase Pin-like site-specific DNA recombinase
MTGARIYVRVSTLKQTDGASLETQLLACRAYV